MDYLGKVILCAELNSLWCDLKDKKLSYQAEHPEKDVSALDRKLDTLERGINKIHELYNHAGGLEKHNIKLTNDLINAHDTR